MYFFGGGGEGKNLEKISHIFSNFPYMRYADRLYKLAIRISLKELQFIYGIPLMIGTRGP